jgi:hypothetical protein
MRMKWEIVLGGRQKWHHISNRPTRTFKPFVVTYKCRVDTVGGIFLMEVVLLSAESSRDGDATLACLLQIIGR